jgi:hypothetical protein
MSIEREPPEIIRRTKMTDCEIVTAKLEDKHAARPYQVFMVINGNRSHITDHVSRAAALHHHDVLVDAAAGEGRHMPAGKSVRSRGGTLMAKVTGLEYARTMRELGLPLSTEVVEGGRLPKRQEQMIRRVLNSADACRAAAYGYIKKQSTHNYAALKCAHNKLGREIEKIPAPAWIDEPDGAQRLTNPEDQVVAAVVGPRCFTAFVMWAEIIAELDTGKEVAFQPPWTPWPTEVGGGK